MLTLLASRKAKMRDEGKLIWMLVLTIADIVLIISINVRMTGQFCAVLMKPEMRF